MVEPDQAMAEGTTSSKNALVERALVKELKQVRREARKRRWEEGAKDPALLKDISDIETAFKSADAEAAGRMG